MIKDSKIGTLKPGDSKHSGYLRVALLWEQARRLFDALFPSPVSTICVLNERQNTHTSRSFFWNKVWNTNYASLIFLMLDLHFPLSFYVLFCLMGMKKLYLLKREVLVLEVTNFKRIRIISKDCIIT